MAALRIGVLWPEPARVALPGVLSLKRYLLLLLLLGLRLLGGVDVARYGGLEDVPLLLGLLGVRERGDVLL